MPKSDTEKTFEQLLDELANRGTVNLSVTFNRDIAIRTMKYTKDNGYTKEQDVIRLALTTFLKKAGY